tara:strand:+ start:341 stop:868 length:528 start_codon:yes stop_codon:yes gene_type:complete
MLGGCDACLFPNVAQLSILEQGVDVWNQWREENPSSSTFFGCVDLSQTNLVGVNFSGTELASTDLSDTNLEAADLTGAIAVSAWFVGANLTMADLSGASLIRANLRGAVMIGSNLADTNLTFSNFAGANLSHANISDVIGWQEIQDISDCNIIEIENAPEGFREWALARGAVEIE